MVDFNPSIRVVIDAEEFLRDLSAKIIGVKIVRTYQKVFNTRPGPNTWRWIVDAGDDKLAQDFRSVRRDILIALKGFGRREVIFARDRMLSLLASGGASALTYSSEDINVTLPALNPGYFQKKGNKPFLDLTGGTISEIKTTAPAEKISGNLIIYEWFMDRSEWEAFNVGPGRQPARPALEIFRGILMERIFGKWEKIGVQRYNDLDELVAAVRRL